MSFDFKGRRFLVTGAGRGIGHDLCLALAKAGGEVYGLSRQSAGLDSLVAECPRIKPVQVDLADWDATRKEVEKLPVMNGIVNNAAVAPPLQPSIHLEKTEMERIMNINLMGALNIIQICGKKMIDADNGGSIVNISSINGVNPMKGCMAYNLSKAALDMMTRQFALELGPHKIRVNSVNPTVVYTDMGKLHWSEGPRTERLLSLTPMDRFAEVHEVVGPIMYLLSDLSSMVTGTVHPVEGGLLSNIGV